MKRTSSATTTEAYRSHDRCRLTRAELLLRPQIRVTSLLVDRLVRVPKDVCLLIAEYADWSLDGHGFVPSNVEMEGINWILGARRREVCAASLVNHVDAAALRRMLFAMLVSLGRVPPRPHLVICDDQPEVRRWQP